MAGLSLDFATTLTAFGAVGSIVLLALAIAAIRKYAVGAMCVFGMIWAAWSLDGYLQRTAQHWGQREIISAYYANRASPDEMLVAYQMNWKGENFYTGNHLAVFVSTGSTFSNWMKKKRDDGARVMYFVTEYGRVGGLKNEVGARSYQEMTDKSLCNKFLLLRADL